MSIDVHEVTAVRDQVRAELGETYSDVIEPGRSPIRRLARMSGRSPISLLPDLLADMHLEQDGCAARRLIAAVVDVDEEQRRPTIRVRVLSSAGWYRGLESEEFDVVRFGSIYMLADDYEAERRGSRAPVRCLSVDDCEEVRHATGPGKAGPSFSPAGGTS